MGNSDILYNYLFKISYYNVIMCYFYKRTLSGRIRTTAQRPPPRLPARIGPDRPSSPTLRRRSHIHRHLSRSYRVFGASQGNVASTTSIFSGGRYKNPRNRFWLASITRLIAVASRGDKPVNQINRFYIVSSV